MLGGIEGIMNLAASVMEPISATARTYFRNWMVMSGQASFAPMGVL